MRALTGSEVLVADKLFATLDTTVRALHPESTPRILISDTVGFIKRLPHDLVASFRSTLDEALGASLLLFTVDASDPTFRSQLEVTQKVINEIGADKIPHQLVLNKVDRLSDDDIQSLRTEFANALFISTRKQDDIEHVRTAILDFFEKNMVEEIILLPFAKGNLTGEVRRLARVINDAYDERGALLTLRAQPDTLAHIKKIIRTS